MALWFQVYQEKALKDKERYRIEMEGYRERQRTGQVISDAVPLQQRFPVPLPDVEMAEADRKLEETEAGDSPQTPENDSSSDGSDFEDDQAIDKDLDMEESPGGESMNVDLEISTQPVIEQLSKVEENIGNNKVEKLSVEGEGNLGKFLAETNKEPMPSEGTLKVGSPSARCGFAREREW